MLEHAHKSSLGKSKAAFDWSMHYCFLIGVARSWKTAVLMNSDRGE